MKLRSSSNIPCLQRIFSRQICLYRELTERSSVVNKIIVNLEAFASHGCISGRFIAGPVYLGACLSRNERLLLPAPGASESLVRSSSIQHIHSNGEGVKNRQRRSLARG